MLTSKLIADVRRVITSCSGSASDADIVAIADDKLRSLIRKQAATNVGYYNCELNYQPGDFTEVAKDQWEMRTPAWSSRVSEVMQINPLSEFNRIPRLAGGMAVTRNTLRMRGKQDYGRGWQFIGTDRIRVHASAQDLHFRIRFVKLPSQIVSFTMTEKSDSTRSFVMPAAPDIGEYGLTEHTYVNTRFQVSGVSDGEVLSPRLLLGQYRIGVASNPNHIAEDNTRRTRVFVDEDWTEHLEVGDQIETFIELPDEHTELLVLLVAERVFQKTNNMKALKSIADSMMREWEAYLGYIQPRQTQEPHVARRNLHDRFDGYQENPDQYHRRRRY